MNYPGIKLLCFYLILTGYTIEAQEIVRPEVGSGNENQYIRWISQYPPVETGDQLKFGQKLVSALFGKSNNPIVSKPVAVYAGDTNYYWIVDQGNGFLYQVEEKVGDIPQLKAKDFKKFPSLVGICSLPGGKLLFSDSFYNQLYTIKPGKNLIEILNDSLVLNRPTGIAYSPVNQEIWVVETNGHCVSVLNEHGQLIRKIGRRGDGPGEFNFPTYIWIDKFGKVFIVDAMNFRIQVFSEDGEIVSIFGKIGDGSGSFARPRGIATDSDGNIYVADALFNSIQIFDINGNFLYNFGMQGQDQGKFWMPAGIFIDEQDYIYVADTYNSRVQIFKYLKSGTK